MKKRVIAMLVVLAFVVGAAFAEGGKCQLNHRGDIATGPADRNHIQVNQ